MITIEKVITVNGRLENRGEWDHMPYEVEVVGNPFPGPAAAPNDWDFQITYRTEYANPLPEGAIEEELEVFFDRLGSLRLARDAASLEVESRIASANIELAELMTDVTLGLATDSDKARAVELRTFIKSA